ncbi:MAG TPA: hypothetical protein DGG94_22530 [Micromonosporaceae bacterium]|nr:hypothetical protein [Micromonosporaceae bacterium]
MSSIPSRPRRDWTVPVLLGAVALAVLVVVCVAGSAAAFLSFRAKPANNSSATPAPSTSRPAPTQPPATMAPADCLIGDWEEVSYVTNSEIYGVTVQLTGKGSLIRFAADGTSVTVLNNVVVSGSAQGSSYEVIHNGSLALNYVADATTINYSNPKASGTTTWKVDGKVRDTEPIRASLKPDTYRCQGNDLRLFSETGATELKRILPPGTPV